MALAQPARGETYARQFEVTSQSYLGYAQFTVSYNTPASAVVGANLTLSAVVTVNDLTGAENDVRDYVLLVILFCDNHSVNSSQGSPTPTQRYLYPGAFWGPLNFSIPLTEEDTGLSPGDTANASVTLRLITDVSYDSPGYRLSGYAPVFGDGSTFVLIRDPGTQQAASMGAIAHGVPLMPSLLVACGVVLLALSNKMPRSRVKSRGEIA
ncbi:MAG: hypothetical protein OK442_02775 [Thaumarchaeota archaeon]|nr:hypothetical protein [Nitrososphaerota archaeon]